MEASFLLDVCDKCEENIGQKNKFKEQVDDKVRMLESVKDELSTARKTCEEYKDDVNKKISEIASLQNEICKVKKEKDSLSLEIEKKDLENLQLKNDIKAMTNNADSHDVNGILEEKNDEIERGKLIIQERDKTIKKLKENHKKEVLWK